MSTVQRVATLLLPLAALVALALGPISVSTGAACYQGGPANGPHCPGHPGGTPEERLPFASQSADAELVAGLHARDWCHEVAGWARVHYETNHNIRVPYYYVWAKTSSSGFQPAILLCSTLEELHGHTTGPGGHGISLPCPTLPLMTRTPQPKLVGWYVAHYNHHYFQAYGGFGHNDDGFWHYKLHKASSGTTLVRLFGYCA